MTINSRQKGKRAELKIAHELQKYGYEARRSQQYAGINNDADVVGVPFLHIEVKNVQREAVRTWMKQSIRDAKEDEIPVVMHKKDREPWLVTIGLDDFMKMYRCFEKDWSGE